MDSIDLCISKLLLLNSRQTYREIADQVGISINAVHKRIQNMVETGMIGRFRTNITLQAFHGVSILIIGKTNLNSFQMLVKNIRRNNRFYWVTLGAGNLVYLGAYLQSIEDLHDTVSFATNSADLSEIKVGIIPSLPLVGDVMELSHIDYQILAKLSENARITATEIAEILPVSAKTINNHINAMMERSLIEFTMDWFPDQQNDIFCYFHLYLDLSVSKSQIIQELNKKFVANQVFILEFSNIPDFLFSVWWVNSFKQLTKLREAVHEVPGIKKIEVNMMYEGKIFKTWRDEYIFQKVNSKKENA